MAVPDIGSITQIMGVRTSPDKIKPGQKMASFSVSDLHLVSVNPHDIVWVIKENMRLRHIGSITHTWKSPSDHITHFSGPVETYDALAGMLLTRKVAPQKPEPDWFFSGMK